MRDYKTITGYGGVRIAEEGKGFIKKILVKTNSTFFEGETIIRINESRISFTKPNIDYSGKTYNLHHMNSGWYSTSMLAELPTGRFDFDEEESNEDELIAYFENQEL